jgi:hypothetical protein
VSDTRPLCGFAALREISFRSFERAQGLKDCLTQSREAAKDPVPVEIERLATIAVDCGLRT